MAEAKPSRITPRNPDPLPPIDQATLEEAIAAAEASHWAPDPPTRKRLEERALRLWGEAHQARRDAMCARGRQ